ncbi:hypothetical protein [Chitinophaga agri]|uniref:Uncharacterized protein n=1 Tax=Chitinophaga agri TaxID=2703787 RepID=A0A6B9ZF49_9BACT|nr:hypothetical protein [Chitinophaga agri]QHS61000.1 hypothetical protein GWR21_15765 [Chitinophaga agri]
MTTSSYNRIRALLIEQKRQVTDSSEAAAKLITDLGIRDILVNASTKKAAPQKAAPKKTVAVK